MNRIEINGDGRCPVEGFAIQREDESPIDAVIRSVERRTGKRCYTRRQDCRRVDGDGRTIDIAYAATFVGAKCSGGGYPISFETTFWVDAS